MPFDDFDKFIRRTEPHGRSELVILAEASIAGGIEACDVFLNGYSVFPAHEEWERDPKNSLTTLVPPGRHRLIAKMGYVLGPDRIESNELFIEAADAKKIVLTLAHNGNALVLAQRP